MDEQRAASDGTYESSLDRESSRFAETPIRSYMMAGVQPDSGWQQVVSSRLCQIGADLEETVAAVDVHDWAAVLQAVRLIQGRAVTTRGLLERMLGQPACEPSLVRAIRSIKRQVSDCELDSLPPDELRARMRAVLQTLDRELKAVLSPAD